MLNSQKLFLSAIRLVTGFVGAGCYQFQIEPEVLIKPSSLVSFSFLPETSKLEPSVYKQIFSLSFMLASCGQWLPGVGRPCQRAASSRVAAVGCAGRGHCEENRCAQPLQMHIKSTRIPEDCRQQPGSWLAGALLLGSLCSRWSPWHGCPAELWTNSFIESSSKAVGMRVTSQGGRISSPSLETAASMSCRKPGSRADVYTRSVCQTPWTYNSAQSFEKYCLWRQSTILPEERKSWIFFNRRKSPSFCFPPTFSTCNLRISWFCKSHESTCFNIELLVFKLTPQLKIFDQGHDARRDRLQSSALIYTMSTCW